MCFDVFVFLVKYNLGRTDYPTFDNIVTVVSLKFDTISFAPRMTCRKKTTWPQFLHNFRKIKTCTILYCFAALQYLIEKKRLGQLQSMMWPYQVADLVYFSAYNMQMKRHILLGHKSFGFRSKVTSFPEYFDGKVCEKKRRNYISFFIKVFSFNVQRHHECSSN